MADILPLKRYDLERLIRPYHFPTDTEDDIESVTVMMVEMTALNGRYKLTFQALSHSDQTLYEDMETQFGIHSPLECGYYPSKATLCICFKPESMGQEGKTLPITITGPYRCDLENKTEKERLMGEKYLKRWQLIQETPAERQELEREKTGGISLEDFKVLNRIATSPSRAIIGRVLVEYFAAACYRLIESGALVHIANLEKIWVRIDGHEARSVKVVRYEGKDAYFSPTEGWVEVNPLDIKLYQVSSEWLLKTFKEALKIAPSVKPRVILAEKVWALGDAWLHKVRHPIILGQNLYRDEVFKTLEAYLKKKSQPKTFAYLDIRLKSPCLFSASRSESAGDGRRGDCI